MASLLKDIKNMEDLRRRQKELREEAAFSRQAIEYSLDHIVDRGAIRKVLLTAGLSAAATLGLRFLSRQAARSQSAEAYASAATEAGTGPWAPYLPLLRTAANYLLDFLEDWLRRR